MDKIYIPRDIYFIYIPQLRDIYKYISQGIYILSRFVPEKIEPSESGGNESLRALKHRNCLVENTLIYYHPCSNVTTDYHPVFPWRSKTSANTIQPSKWDIYCIYGSVSWYMQQYTPSTSAFFRPRPAASDEKMPRSRGYIVAYTPRQTRIYITYIYIYIYLYIYTSYMPSKILKFLFKITL